MCAAVCDEGKTYPGLDEDLYVTAEAEAFVKWHAGQLTWADATRDRRVQLHGPSWLVQAFPTWNARSAFAHIKPVSRTAGFGVTAELDGVGELSLQLRQEPGAGGAGSTSPRSTVALDHGRARHPGADQASRDDLNGTRTWLPQAERLSAPAAGPTAKIRGCRKRIHLRQSPDLVDPRKRQHRKRFG